MQYVNSDVSQAHSDLWSTAHGIIYRTIDGAHLEPRIYAYGFYSDGFYNEVARAALANDGRIDSVQNAMMRLCANELSLLHPKYIHVWGSILFDVFFSTRMDMRLSKYICMCRDGWEFEYLYFDIAFRPTSPLVDHVGSNYRKKINQKQSTPFNEQLRTVHVVRGSCGSVLLFHPMLSESI